LDGLCGEDAIAEYASTKALPRVYITTGPEVGKKRLSGDIAKSVSTSEVEDFRREAQ